MDHRAPQYVRVNSVLDLHIPPAWTNPPDPLQCEECGHNYPCRTVRLLAEIILDEPRPDGGETS